MDFIMASGMNRRDFFRSFGKGFIKEKANKNTYIRPPYCEDAELFLMKCPNCVGHCTFACKQDIIRLAPDETAYLDFSNNGCTFCGDCAKACDKGVLIEGNPKLINAMAQIDTSTCIAWQTDVCTECSKACEVTAILTYSSVRPEVDMEACTGCGICVSVCPEKSIKMIYSHKFGE